jgi:hypothetical protein
MEEIGLSRGGPEKVKTGESSIPWTLASYETWKKWKAWFDNTMKKLLRVLETGPHSKSIADAIVLILEFRYSFQDFVEELGQVALRTRHRHCAVEKLSAGTRDLRDILRPRVVMS